MPQNVSIPQRELEPEGCRQRLAPDESHESLLGGQRERTARVEAVRRLTRRSESAATRRDRRSLKTQPPLPYFSRNSLMSAPIWGLMPTGVSWRSFLVGEYTHPARTGCRQRVFGSGCIRLREEPGALEQGDTYWPSSRT